MKYQNGFSLLESLVTVTILGVGLLGLAGMQAQGIKFSSSSYARTQASMLAADIIDRMRIHGDEMFRQYHDSNTTEVSDYVDEYVTSSKSYTPSEGGDDKTCKKAGDTIEESELIAHNVACWENAVLAQLDGTGKIDLVSDDNPDLLRVSIEWTDRVIRVVEDTKESADESAAENETDTETSTVITGQKRKLEITAEVSAMGPGEDDA